MSVHWDSRYRVLGTCGCQCKQISLAMDDRDLLCCGMGSHVTQMEAVERCSCKTCWCCCVKCKQCQHLVEVHGWH